MNINYDILQNLLRCNKNLKLKFRGDSTILDVLLYTEVILTLELESNDLTKYSEFIYEGILNLEGITIYIPKIYIK